MIRVGFELSFTDGGLGKINYYRNLISALHALPDAKIKPVIITGYNNPNERFDNFPPVEIIRTRYRDRFSLPWLVRKLWYKFFGRDYLFELFLIKNGIAVLSHANIGPNASIKTVGWISDFQHRHLQKYFSKQELVARDEEFYKIALESNIVLLSSLDAQEDFKKFAPDLGWKSRILRFVPEVDIAREYLSLDKLKEKYKFDGAYLYLPNQWWIHKNHQIVIDALLELSKHGIQATVLVTGALEDYRHPDYATNLMKYVVDSGLQHSFRILGVVPYEDLISLMHHSLAVINPSFFEGWSTTVEEAKVLGKVVLLSNINVHIEQNPSLGVFFNPNNCKELANLIKKIIQQPLNQNKKNDQMEGIAQYKTNRANFALDYQNIILELF